LESGKPLTSTDGSINLPKENHSNQSEGWKDAEILYLRGEVERLRAELDQARASRPFRNWELRERGIE